MKKTLPTQLLTAIMLCASLYSVPGLAIKLPTESRVPGGIAIIPLNVTSAQAPLAKLNGKRVMVVKDPANHDHWLAIAGIALGATLGQHTLLVYNDKTPQSISFNVEKKAYETQYLTIKNKRKVNPNKKDLERIGREKTQISAALQAWNITDPIDMRFQVPVQGHLSSPFGLRRIFNKQPRNPHSGLDIAAPAGAPIVAPAAGKVINTGDFFFNGNTVFLDHGNGLVSMFCHMSRIDVKDGQTVAQGDTLGAVGMTGRVTGPHLHWGISLNDARIDPKLFFEDIKTQLAAKP